MKLRTILSFAIFIFIIVNVSKAQIDTTRNHEIRYGLVGSTLFSPDFDPIINTYPRFNDMTLSYLRRFKSTPYMLKAEISGKAGGGYGPYSADVSVGQGTFYNNALFLGVERQTNFRHFGWFLGAGIRGSYVNLKADYNLPDNAPVNDFIYTSRSIGIAAHSTFVTNITDNLYVFLTSTFYAGYVNSSANKELGVYAELEYKGFDSRLVLFDGLGLAYKF